MGWPVVSSAGGPRARGRAYGELARDRVHGSLALYERIFAAYTGLGWDDVRRRAAAFAEPIDAYDVQLLPELEGIAEGAGVDAEDILALNVRTEVMYGMDGGFTRPTPQECTALCVRAVSAEGGPTIHAENWDWKPGVADTCVLLACAPHDRPGFVTLVEAGLLAKCGMNEAGIALTANALASSRDRGRPGVPFHAILRRILTATTFEEAVEAVTRPWRAASGNYLVSDAHGHSVNLETGPGGAEAIYETDAPTLAHANHFLWVERPFEDLGRIDGEDSLRRQAAADGAVAAGGTAETLTAVLRNHEGYPDSVCSHRDPTLAPETDHVTIASLVMRPALRTLQVSQGPPCEHPYEAVDVAGLVEAARATVA